MSCSHYRKVLYGLLALTTSLSYQTSATAAETASADLPTVVQASMHFRPILHQHGVEFRWFRYPKPKEFVRYEIIRTAVKPARAYIADGTVAGETGNRYSTNFEDILDAGTYYYQLCSVTKTKRVCSAVKPIKITSRLPADAQVLPVAADANVKFSPAPPGQLDLSVNKDAAGNHGLSWTPLADSGAGFKWYKPVRSRTASDPYYPRDGYLAHIANIQQTAFIDQEAASGTTYYRVCAVDGADGLWCGNVVTAEK